MCAHVHIWVRLRWFPKKHLLSRGICNRLGHHALHTPYNYLNQWTKKMTHSKLNYDGILLNYLNSLKCRHLCQLFTLVVKIQVAPPVKQEYFVHVPSGFPLRNPFVVTKSPFLAYESYFVDHAFFRYAIFFSNNPLHRTSI